MKNKTLLLISLLFSSSILHAELNPLTGAATDMVKDAATDAVKEKVTDTAKDMVKEAVTPATTTDTAKEAEVTKTPAEAAPVVAEEPAKTVKKTAHKKSSKKKH